MSAFGSTSVVGGRPRCVASLIPVTKSCVTNAAAATCTKIHGRLYTSAATNAMTSQTIAREPASESPTKTGFSQPARCSTTRRSRY